MDFCSIVKKDKIFGTQFHPEKSGSAGIEFLKNLKKLKD
jgi:imidazoleglycerol phosphate synthase glutamine amidotransferase subunit HisH